MGRVSTFYPPIPSFKHIVASGRRRTAKRWSAVAVNHSVIRRYPDGLLRWG